MKKKTGLKILVAFIYITVITALGLNLNNPGLFKGTIQLEPTHFASEQNNQCKSIRIAFDPPGTLLEYEGTDIILETEPEDFDNVFSFSATSGSFDDFHGKTGSYIETNQKRIHYSGGETDTVITAQAIKSENQNCVAILTLKTQNSIVCTAMEVNYIPGSSTKNSRIEIKTDPQNFTGQFFLETQNGKFQLESTDPSASGENSNSLLTTKKEIVLSGAIQGEKITIKTLGEKNSACYKTIEVP